MEPSSSTMLQGEDSDSNRVVSTTKENDGIKCSIPANNRAFRRHIDAAFQKHGSQLPEQIMKSHYVDKCKYAAVEAYVNEFATKSEECVYEKMRDKEEFVQVTNWCELMHSADMKTTSNQEILLALRTIAMTETFPEPKQAHGVNFKLLYLNLSNMMLGHPIQEMNVATAKVLKDVYEETMSKMQVTDNQEDSALLRPACLLTPKPSTTENLSHSGLSSFFTDRNLNPLQIPFDKLFRVSK